MFPFLFQWRLFRRHVFQIHIERKAFVTPAVVSGSVHRDSVHSALAGHTGDSVSESSPSGLGSNVLRSRRQAAERARIKRSNRNECCHQQKQQANVPFFHRHNGIPSFQPKQALTEVKDKDAQFQTGPLPDREDFLMEAGMGRWESSEGYTTMSLISSSKSWRTRQEIRL